MSMCVYLVIFGFIKVVYCHLCTYIKRHIASNTKTHTPKDTHTRTYGESPAIMLASALFGTFAKMWSLHY